MEQTRNVLPMKAAKIGYIVLSLLFCALGILLMLLPEFSPGVMGRLLAAGMILFGAVKLVGYFSKDLFRLAFQYDLAFGILLIALGIITLARPKDSMSFLCVMLGVAVLTDGLFKVQIAIDAKVFGIRRWWLILGLAILSGGFGIALVVRPSESLNVLSMLLGLGLLAEGILNLCVALCTVKIVRHQKPDVVEVNDFIIR